MFEDSRTKLFVIHTANGAPATYAAIPNRAGAFFIDPQTYTVTLGPTTNAALVHRFVFRNTRGVLSSTAPFLGSQIRNAQSASYAARSEQITYLGFNGVAGSMDVANNTYFGLKVILNHTFGMLNNSPLMVTLPYKTDATGTQRELACGIAVSGTNWLKRQAYKPFKVERVNSGLQLLVHNNIALVNGSKTITSADDDTLTLLNGTVIRVPDTVDGAPSYYDPCYVIVSNDGGAGAARVYTLDQEYQGTSKADHDTVETVTEANWGVKFTGISVADADFDPITDTAFVSNFELEAGDFTTATVTYGTAVVATGAATPAFLGVGTWQQVASMEALYQFQNKTREISAYPPTIRNIDATVGDTYSFYEWEVWEPTQVSATTGTVVVSKNRYIIAILVGLAAASDFDVVLGGITAPS